MTWSVSSASGMTELLTSEWSDVNGTVFWEARRIMCSWPHRKDADITRTCPFDHIKAWLPLLHGTPATAWIPHPPPPSARLADCRQAWQRKMQGLLLLLLWWAIYRRRVEEQSIALCLFHVLLAGERARPPSGAFCQQVFV